MRFKTNILILIILLNVFFSCSNEKISSNNEHIYFDTIKVYDTIKVKQPKRNSYSQISAVKTFGLFVNIEVPIEIFVEGISDSLLEITTNNGIIRKLPGRSYHTIKTEKTGSTVIKVSHNGKEITSKFFSAIRLPKPTARLGNFRGKTISKKELLTIPGLWAEMPGFCDLYGAGIKSFCTVVYQDGIELKLKSENSRFTNEQIELFEKLKPGQAIYFEDISSKTQDGFEHKLEIVKIIIH